MIARRSSPCRVVATVSEYRRGLAVTVIVNVAV